VNGVAEVFDNAEHSALCAGIDSPRWLSEKNSAVEKLMDCFEGAIVSDQARFNL
jgi:hypothetical protein